MYKGKPDAPVTVSRYLRNYRGITMEGLAAATGIKFQTIFNLEHRKGIDLYSLKILSAYFGVSLDCLARNDLAAAAKKMYSPVVRKNHIKQLIRDKEKLCEEIGDRGERLIIERERKKLCGTPYALAVNGNVSDDVTAGFDVLSFDDKGAPIYIEVKTTINGPNTPYYLSRCELSFLYACYSNGNNYQLHRIYNLKDTDDYDLMILSAEDVLKDYNIEPISYIVRRNEDDRR